MLKIMCGSFTVADRSKKRKSMRRRILPALNAAFPRRPFWNSTRPEVSFTIGAGTEKDMSGRTPITALLSTTKVTSGSVETVEVHRRVLRPPVRAAREELRQLDADKRRRARLPTKRRWQAFRDIFMTA